MLHSVCTSVVSFGNKEKQPERHMHTEGGRRCSPPSRNSEGPPKLCQTQPDCEKLLKIAEFRMPTSEDIRKKGSKILKLPRFAIVLH